MAVTGNTCKVFSGRANPGLAAEICQYLSLPLGDATLGRFSDGETYFQINENVRGADVFVVQPTCHPVDCHLMELLLMVDALKRASAARITAVIPYYGYARQDRKDRPRVPISAKLVADLLEKAGIDRALTLDLHAPQIQGYFNVPVDHLYATPVLLEAFARSPRMPAGWNAHASLPRRWQPPWPLWISAGLMLMSRKCCTSSARWKARPLSSPTILWTPPAPW
jgi:ribose-phosphate pyrophosphokinase